MNECNEYYVKLSNDWYCSLIEGSVRFLSELSAKMHIVAMLCYENVQFESKFDLNEQNYNRNNTFLKSY